MFFRGLQEALDDLHRLAELFRELVVLAVAPGRAEVVELAVEDGHAALEVVVELPKVLREAAEFGRIDVGLGRHGRASLQEKSGCGADW